MLGLPGETGDELMETLDFVRTLYTRYPNTLPAFGLFTPYPGSEASRELIHTGVITQPKTLRVWVNPSVRAIYSDRSKAKPWHENPQFMENVLHYARVAYHFYPFSITKRGLLYFLKSPLRYRGMILVLIAQWRIKNLRFALRIDRLLYEWYNSIRTRLKHLFD
jgi:hypothetical protein